MNVTRRKWLQALAAGGMVMAVPVKAKAALPTMTPKRYLTQLWNTYYKRTKQTPKLIECSQAFYDTYSAGLQTLTRTGPETPRPEKYLGMRTAKVKVNPTLHGWDIRFDPEVVK